MIKLGASPGIISRFRKVSLATTLSYVDQMIGQGRLRRSDVVFSIPKEVREKCAGAEVRPRDVSRDDYETLKRYGDAAHATGDMYEDLRCIEVSLHSMVRLVLIESFGEPESGWWRQGVPEQIRKTCQVRREEDSEPAEGPYSYTDLLDLARVIEAHWSIFSSKLPVRYAANRKALLEDFRRLNGIRRIVMHPVRGGVPTEEDFEFTRHLRRELVPEDTDNLSKDELLQQVKDYLALAGSGSSEV
jgi:hypothetical protein